MHFLFDLDSTITKDEIIPFIAKNTNCDLQLAQELVKMTSKAMEGTLPFETSFRERVKMLSHIPLETIQTIVSNIPLNLELLSFIKENKKQCSIVTSNIDLWISKLVEKIDIPCFSSKATIQPSGSIEGINIIRKIDILKQFSEPVTAIGDGVNDIELLGKANISIAYGGIRRKLARPLLEVADYAIYNETTLCRLLESLTYVT